MHVCIFVYMYVCMSFGALIKCILALKREQGSVVVYIALQNIHSATNLTQEPKYADREIISRRNSIKFPPSQLYDP